MRPSAGEARSSTRAALVDRVGDRARKLAQRRVAARRRRRDRRARAPRGTRRRAAASASPMARRSRRRASVRAERAPPRSARAVSTRRHHAKIRACNRANASPRVRACSRRTRSKSASGEQLERVARARAPSASRRRRARAPRRNRALRAFASSASAIERQRLRREFLAQQLVHERRIGLAARRLHDLADEKTHHVGLSRRDSRQRRFGFAASTSSTKPSIAAGSLVCASPSRSTIAAGEPAPSHMRASSSLAIFELIACRRPARSARPDRSGDTLRIGDRDAAFRWQAAKDRRARSCSTAAGSCCRRRRDRSNRRAPDCR